MSKRLVVLQLAIATAFVFTGHQAVGQTAPAVAGKSEYTELEVNAKYKPIAPEIVASNEAAAIEDTKRARDRSMAYNNARKVLSGQIPFDDAGKKVLDEWYMSYYLKSFTSAENLGALPEMRNTLLNKDLRPARSAAAIAHVRSLVLGFMKGYAQNSGKYNFHPAVRYNAMLVIGDLNLVEYGARYPNNQKAMVPEPLPEALDLLISEYKSPTQIDAVRVAALVGLDRHVKLDLGRPAEGRIPGPKKKVIVDEMIALLNSAPPATRSPAGHTWMQRRAIDILAALGMVGVYPEANAALEKIVADKDAPISLRCTASEALARWAPNGQKNDASTVSRNLGLIAVKACKDELDRIAALVTQEKEMKMLRELIKKPNPAATGQFGAGGYGGGTEMSGGGEMYGGDMGAGGEEMYGGGDDMPGGMGGMGDMDGGMGGMDGGMGGMYGGMGGMYGGMPGIGPAAIPTDPRIIWSQRRLKYQLTCVKQGLRGMAIAGKSSQHEKVVDQITKAVELALALTDPPAEKPDLEGLTQSIQKGLNGLAFLAPQAAAIDTEPVSELPPGADPTEASALPPGVTTSTPAPPADVPSDLPPGL
ncbi:MAG TPA: hypothetical protein VMM76_17700 [Pirellulaceae bacterium]|nr:hypothetical protein [Pirellulaceae bacterium]